MRHHFFRGVFLFGFTALLLSALPAYASRVPSIPAYRDAQSIQYKEAVDVISALKIMEGYTNETFRPAGTLTRGAASKIIANLSITPDNVSFYQTTQNAKPFSDVPKEHVFTNHITYCFQNHFISGYEDHTFRPGDPLTYNAFLKMLLCVLGHDQYNEGYTGENWSERVRADALKSGLLMGLRDEFTGKDNIPREVAALFAFNALQANQVYSSGGVVSPRITASGVERYEHIRDAKVRYADDKYDNQLVQFGEERFPDLVRTARDGLVTWSYEAKPDQLGATKQRFSLASYSDRSEFQEYTVSFDYNAEETYPFEIESVPVVNGNIYGDLPSPQRSGYGFAGWFTQSYGGEQVTSSSPVWLKGDVTLYAQWTSGRYYAYFNANGGSVGVGKDRMEIPLNGVLTNLPRPTREGYAFLGWYTDPQDGERIRNGDSVSPSEPSTLYAHWTPQEYRVTFLASGVNVSPPFIMVTYGEMYGELPKLKAKNGVPFAGWYTDSDASGVRIDENTPVQLTSNQTLYAHWSAGSDVASCLLTFRADGAEFRTIRMRPGSQLTQWPAAPGKDDFEFTGWVESVSGAVPDLPLTVNSDLLFDASYRVLKICTVTFHSEGFDESDLPDPISAAPGTQLEELPRLTPKTDDTRHFIGWMSDGVRLSPPLTLQSDLDLYAIWEEPLSRKYFAYYFDNSVLGFRYTSTFVNISPERFKLIFGNNRLAQEVYLREYKESKGKWKGNCYGMSTTSGMFQYQYNDINISDFADPESGVKIPYQIDRPDLYKSSRTDWDNLSLIGFIEAMQISQKTISFIRTYWENFDSLNGLCEEVSRVSESGGGAPVICIYKEGKSHAEDKGHALLGYYLEEHEDYSRLYVYDCNYPHTDLFLTLTKDKNGNYTKWRYDYAKEFNKNGEEEAENFELWGSELDGTLTYIPYETYYFIWQRRGNEDMSMNFLSTDLTDAAIYDGDGNRLASFRDGEIQNTDDIRRNSVYPLVDLDENPSGEPAHVAVWLPDASEYRIENTAPYGNMPQDVTLSSAERSVNIKTKARAVTLSVDKSISLTIEQEDGEQKTETGVRLHAAVDGRDEDMTIKIEGVRLPESVSPYAAENASIVWRGSAASGAQLTLDLSESVQRLISTGVETKSLLVNGEDMTDRLNNASNGIIYFNN